MGARKHEDRRGNAGDRRIPRLKRMIEGYEERQAKNPNNKYIEAELTALRWALSIVEHYHRPDRELELEIVPGLTLYAYPSSLEDGRYVIELETCDDPASRIKHDRDGRPQMKVMINEAIISNDGGEESVSVESRVNSTTNTTNTN